MMSNNLSHTVDAFTILDKCCTTSVTGELCLLPNGQVLKARFHKVTRERLVLVVKESEGNGDLQSDALCYVTFPHAESLYNFAEPIKTVRDGAIGIEVLFTTPALLIAANRRKSFRVPIVHPADVQIELRLADGTRIRSTAAKLSESSLEVDVANRDASLPVGAEVQVELHVKEDRIEFPAVVRRSHNARRALTFNLLESPDLRQAAGTLQRIVRRLEQVWLKSRLT